MQANDIIPFLKATRSVFGTMLSMGVEFEEPTSPPPLEPARHHASGIIGISGDLVGALALLFPRQTAEKCVEALAGQPVDAEDELYADAIGELANMICGAAKAQYEGKNVSISCPSVVTGEGHRVHQLSGVRSVCLPCSCDAGPFFIVVSLRSAEAGERSAAA